jgi:Fe2+ transport system protein FeoA
MTSRSDFSIMKAETSIFRVDYLESLNPHCPLRRRILVFGITEGLR